MSKGKYLKNNNNKTHITNTLRFALATTEPAAAVETEQTTTAASETAAGQEKYGANGPLKKNF